MYGPEMFSAQTSKSSWFHGAGDFGPSGSKHRRYRSDLKARDDYEKEKGMAMEDRAKRVGLGRKDLAHSQGRVPYSKESYGDSYIEVDTDKHARYLGHWYDPRNEKGWGGKHNTRMKEDDEKIRLAAKSEGLKKQRDLAREVTLLGGHIGAAENEAKERATKHDPFSRSFPSELQSDFEQRRQAAMQWKWQEKKAEMERLEQQQALARDNNDAETEAEALAQEVALLEAEAERKKSQIRSLQSREFLQDDDLPPLSVVPLDQLEQYFTDLFAVKDNNRDGVLQPAEFVSLLQHAATNDEQANILIAAAEVNQDGLVEFDQFVPAVCQLLREERGVSPGARPQSPRSVQQLAVPESAEQLVRALFSQLSSSPRGGMVLSDVRTLLAVMLPSPKSSEVNDTFEGMLCCFGNEGEPPVILSQFTQFVMRIIYQAFDRLQDPATGMVVPCAVQQLYGTALEAYVTPHSSPPLSAAAASRSGSPPASPALSAQVPLEPSITSPMDEWKEHMRQKQQFLMRGRSPTPSTSVASTPQLKPSTSPAGSRSRSPRRSPQLSSASPPQPPELSLVPASDMPFESFVAFVLSELRRSVQAKRFHEGLGLVYQVGTGI